MELIACIVRYQQQTPFVARHTCYGSKDLFRRWRSEDIAACYGGEESIANVAGPRWLVPGTATGDKRDL